MAGDKVIIVAYASFDEAQAKDVRLRVILVAERIASRLVENSEAEVGASYFLGGQ